MLKHKKISILLFISAICLSVILIAAILRTYDPSKQQIFEIPGTQISYEHSGTKYYMIQNSPVSNDELIAITNNYLDSNDTTDYTNQHYTQYYHFMIPSFSFPIDFEENASFLKMDDYVENYISTNCVLTITKENGKSHHWFNKKAISNRRNQFIIILVLAISVAVCIIIGLCNIKRKCSKHN